MLLVPSPIPANFTVVVGTVALLPIDKDAEAVPGEVGANATEYSRLRPGRMVCGTAGPVMWKAGLDMAREVIFRGSEPVLLTCSFCEALWPTVTLLKSKVEGETEIVAVCGVGAGLPWGIA